MDGGKTWMPSWVGRNLGLHALDGINKLTINKSTAA
jgi:hypothetical protein